MATPKLAIVINHEAVRWLLTELLCDVGYEVIVVYHPASMDTLIYHTRPQLIIVEVGLNGAAEGWELVDRLSRNPIAQDIPLLVCSVDQYALHDEVPALQRPNVATLVFPAVTDTLLMTIRALLEQHDVPRMEQTHAAEAV